MTENTTWGGPLPAGWSWTPLYATYDVALGKMLNPAAADGPHQRPYVGNQHVQWDEVRDDDLPTMSVAPHELARYSVQTGDLLVCEGGDVGRTAIWTGSRTDCCYQKALHRLRPRRSSDEPRFLYYVMRAAAGLGVFHADGNQSTIIHLTAEKLRRLRVPVPPPSKQRSIVAFLDRSTSAIDELIAKKERLVALLQEKRQALITQAVTKGLDPGVPSKPSRVSWAGELPEHWRELPIKRLARSGRGTFTDGDWIEAPYITGAGVRLLQTGNVGVGTYKEQGGRYISEATFDELRCTELAPGDVMICRLDGPVGRACIAPDLGVRMVTSVDNAILKVSDQHDGRFVVYALSSPRYLEWVQALCRVGGGFRFRVSRSMLGDFLVPVPPRHEQSAIANHLDAATASSRATESRLAESITKLREYRQALITAAVTGQIDVTREHAA